MEVKYVSLNTGPNRKARRAHQGTLVICLCGVAFKARQSTEKCKMCRRREGRKR